MRRVLLALWAASLPLSIQVAHADEEVTVELPGGVTMEMVWIEPGTFTMGTTQAQEQMLSDKGLWNNWFEEREQPAQEVTLTEGFYLGKFELTQAQWTSVMGTQPWSGKDNVQANPEHPAVYISWEDVQALIDRLNEEAGTAIYRLPTEAEWEYASLAGTTRLWSFGDNETLLGDYAWNRDNAWDVDEKYAHAVGTKLPNAWGLHDMYGNVWEWVQDALVDPEEGLTGTFPVVRGGTFYHFAMFTRSAFRNWLPPDFNEMGVGTRLLMIGPKTTSVAPQTWGRIKLEMPE